MRAFFFCGSGCGTEMSRLPAMGVGAFTEEPVESEITGPEGQVGKWMDYTLFIAKPSFVVLGFPVFLM